MYIAKIPGTKYVTSLESQGGQWFLRLKLDNTVEAELVLNKLSTHELQKQLSALFDQVSLQINSFQIDLIHKELVSQISHLLSQDQSIPSSDAQDDDSSRRDPRVDELFAKIEQLESILQTLEDRVDRMEAISR